MALKRKKKPSVTKLEIIRVAIRLFLEEGYSVTSIRQIGEKVGISSGNVMFHFPTKEHLLAQLVDMLCDFQWKLMENETDDSTGSVMSSCLELMSMAAACEENEIAKDFFVSAYQSPMTLEIIRKNDLERSKKVYADYCENWTEYQYIEAETLVSGVEYATLMTTENSAPLDVRISGALNQIMSIYGVPEAIRKTKIARVLDMDYRAVGQRILREFIEYAEKATDAAFEDVAAKKG